MDPAIPPEPGLPTPLAIRYASFLMWAGALLQVAAAVTACLTEDLTSAVVFGIISLIATVFWLWAARAARAAEPGTRSSAVILFAWATMDLIKWRSGGESLPVVIVFALEWLTGLGATVLLFAKGSTAYFRQYRAEDPVRRWARESLARARRRPAHGLASSYSCRRAWRSAKPAIHSA